MRTLVFLTLCFVAAVYAVSALETGEHNLSERRILHNGVDHGLDDSDAHGVSKKDLIKSKGASIPVFFSVPFIGVWAPFFLPINKELLKYGILFGAGLFLTLALEHLISDSQSGISSLTSKSYPFAYLTVVLGYMLTWMTEIIVQAVWSRKEEQLKFSSIKASEERKGLQGEFEELGCCKSTKDLEKNAQKCSGKNCPCNGSECQCLANSEENSVIKAGTALGAAFTGNKEVYAEMGVMELGLADLLLLLLAMCFHSVFEGLVVGLSATVHAVWQNVFSIVIHKFFEGIALGAALKTQDKHQGIWKIFVYATAFSIMAPVGIAIGIALDSTVESKTARWVENIGNALAAGVFIFVCANHLIPKGCKKGPNDRWWIPFFKWFACGLGVMTTSLIQLKHG